MISTRIAVPFLCCLLLAGVCSQANRETSKALSTGPNGSLEATSEVARPRLAGPEVEEGSDSTTTPQGPLDSRLGQVGGAQPEVEPLTIAIGGDIHFEGFLATELDANPGSMLQPISMMMAEADIAIANLETAVTERGVASPKEFNFRTNRDAYTALRASGIDVVSVANNHGMDYGLVGLEDTLQYAEEAEFPVVGAGMDADEAYAPWVTTVRGQSVAVIGATQVVDVSLLDLWTAGDNKPGLASAKEVDRLVAEVQQANVAHDVVVVVLHWGNEGDSCPSDLQQALSTKLAEAGADIIVGGHAHRLQGGGYKGGAFVQYGLGNFVFYRREGPATESGVINIEVTDGEVSDYMWVPARLQDGVATRTPETDGLAEHERQAWNDLRSCTDLSSDLASRASVTRFGP